MLKVAVTGLRQAALVEAANPVAREDWAVVRVEIAPMCTEYKLFAAGQVAAHLGHEAVGEVVELAAPNSRLSVGDRVAVMPMYPCERCALCRAGQYIHCQHGIDPCAFTGSPEGAATMAQYLVKPASLLLPIPHWMTWEQAALTICALGPSHGAFTRGGLRAHDTVLVSGAGPVGLGAVVNAVFAGARVAVTEPGAWRVARALELGAEVAVDPREPDAAERLRAWSGGAGVDMALECAGLPSAQRLCLDVTRRRGTVAFVGECGEPMQVTVSPDLLRTGQTWIGNWHYDLGAYDSMIRVIKRSPVAGRLVSHVFPMSEIQEAFETCESQQCAKVLLRPWA